MLDKLEPTIHDTLMRILAALFESGLVQKVDLGLVYQLFGVPADQVQGTVIDFADPEWVKRYIQFTDPEGENITVKVVNMETGEVTDSDIGMQELFELLDEAEEMPEGISPEDLSPNRTIN